MAHMEYLEISSRVKEPYSFWKKMLKGKAKQRRKNAFSLPSSQSGTVASGLSFVQVKDGIALRVILKAKKESPDEPDETTRAREKLLCYYVQHLIRKQWPGDEDRVKDYIQYPKPNGYQSLHYTAWLPYHTGERFPFEVQVRSEEMHRIAEYGVAAHWDYKLASSGSVSEIQGGKPNKARAQDWIKHVPSGRAMQDSWVFSGSGYKKNKANKTEYFGDQGNFICVSNFSTATMDVPVESSSASGKLLFKAFTERIPAVGTKIRLVLKPKQDKASQ